MRITHSIARNSMVQPFIFLYIVSLYLFSSYRVVVEIVCMVALLISSLKNKRVSIPSRFLFWGLLFISFALYSTINSKTAVYSFRQTIAFIEVFVFSALFMIYLDSSKRLTDLIVMISIAGVILFIFLVLKFPITKWFYGRLGDETYNANSIALNMFISSLSVMFLLKKDTYIGRRRLISYLMLAIFILTILATGSKKGLFSITIGVSMFMLFTQRTRSKRVLVILSLPIVIITAFWIIMNNEALYSTIGIRIDSLLYSRFGFYFKSFSYSNASSDTFRGDLVASGIELWRLHPFFGNGLGSYQYINGTGLYAHNDYVELLVGVGVVGSIIYYARYIYILKDLVPDKKVNSNKNVYCAYFFTILIILIINNFGLVSFAGEFWFILFALMEKYIVLEGE